VTYFLFVISSIKQEDAMRVLNEHPSTKHLKATNLKIISSTPHNSTQSISLMFGKFIGEENEFSLDFHPVLKLWKEKLDGEQIYDLQKLNENYLSLLYGWNEHDIQVQSKLEQE